MRQEYQWPKQFVVNRPDREADIRRWHSRRIKVLLDLLDVTLKHIDEHDGPADKGDLLTLGMLIEQLGLVRISNHILK